MADPAAASPLSGAACADTHAHLDMLEDPAGALERAALAGVRFVVTVVDVTEDMSLTLDGLAVWIAEARARLRDTGIEPPDIRIIAGAHPHNARLFDAAAEGRLIALLADERVAGIGEIGLDFHYDHSPREDQRRAFRVQLDLAHRCGLPVAIHLREAHEEGLALLGDIGIPESGAVIHCFTGDRELAKRFVALGCYVSFAGPVTFKKAEEIREASSIVPLDRLLVETDCPFMAPEPHRGRKNEPAWVTFTASRLAEVRDIDPGVLASATLENARRVFAGRGA